MPRLSPPSIVLAVIIGVLLCTHVSAQQSTRGTEFYLAFLPNYHARTNSTTDSLFLYLVAEKACSGSIRLTNRSGAVNTISFTITNPSQIYTVALNWSDFELAGYNRPNESALNNNSDNEVASKQSIVIHSSENIAVYALNKADKTSDASLILPTTCLGTEYRVLSYNSDGDLSGRQPSDQYTPSEFCVVATQPNTTVSINTSCPTTKSSSNTLYVRLQAGEAYLVQSNFSTQQLNYDLSGSVVRSDKPVAVFSGHQRAKIPVANANMSSRDCLYEQLLPISVWGTKYVLSPLAQPLGQTTQGYDLYRVVASADNTVLQLNDTTLTTLQANGVYEAPLTKAGLLSSSKPVMVALYKKTANAGSSTTADGDPFMMIIPPRRQYLNNYRFTNVQVKSLYHQQFVTIIASINDVPSLKLDGVAMKASFTSVGTSCYAYANVSMTDGAHTITGATPFGLYVYGYGAADSYGYVGGMAFYPDSPDIHLDAGEDQMICPGTPVTLSVQHAGGLIHWKPSARLSCDTCRSITVAPQSTTTYVVSGVDSSGCTSSDTVVVRVPDINTSFHLGNGDSVQTVVGGVFRADISAHSAEWDTAGIVAFRAVIRYNPSLLKFAEVVYRGQALPAAWIYSYRDSIIDGNHAELTIDARGDSALTTDGILLTPYFQTLLADELSVRADLDVSVVSHKFNCATTGANGTVIQMVGCAVQLRRVLISADSTTLFRIAPNPVESGAAELRFSIAFAGQTTIDLYSSDGSERSVLDSRWLDAGEHSVPLDVHSLSNGVYTIVLRSGGSLRTIPLLLLR